MWTTLITPPAGAHKLPRGGEADVFADSGYRGAHKRQCGDVKTRYRGLAWNTAQLQTLFALANLRRVRKKIVQAAAAWVYPESWKMGPYGAKTHAFGIPLAAAKPNSAAFGNVRVKSALYHQFDQNPTGFWHLLPFENRA